MIGQNRTEPVPSNWKDATSELTCPFCSETRALDTQDAHKGRVFCVTCGRIFTLPPPSR